MRYVRTILLAMVAVGLVITAGCSLFGKKKPKWTILAYYDGNCNLDTTKNSTSWVIAEAQELEKVGSTDQVQVFAMMGSLKSSGNCKYYHFEKHENELPDQISSTVIEDLGTKDMSDKRTLKDFIIAGRTRYPAEHYMLMIKDHGGGWRGACIDDQNGAHRMMSLPELREALDTFDFDIISFDACLMSMVEVAYELRHNAKYLVASQFVTYAGTYGSEEWLGYLTATPTSSALDLAKKIATSCMNANVQHQVTGHQAVTDLDSTKTKALAAKIGTLGNDLVTYTGQYGAEVLDAFTQTHSTELDDPAFCDIREFCVKLLLEPHLKDITVVKDDANAVISALNDCIPLTTTNATSVPRGGLCIHFPYRTDMFDSSNYVKCQFTATNWYTFLSQFIAAVGGGGGGGATTVSGTAAWTGHTLSSHTIAMLDTSHGTNIVYIASGQVTPANGAFTVNVDLTQAVETFVDGWDDVDNSGTLTVGDGLGCWDKDGDQTLWSAGDMFTLDPGDQVTNANVTLLEVTDDVLNAYRKRFVSTND